MNPIFFDPVFFLNFLKSALILPYFLFVIIISFYIPGNLIVGRKYFTTWFEEFVVSCIVGLTLWAYQGVVFGYLGMRYLSYVYIAVFLYLWIKQKYYNQFLNISFTVKKPVFYILVIIFIIGIFGQTQKFWAGGNIASDGLHLFAAASDDALWHTALTAQIVRRFPPSEPGLVGIAMQNYHYWSNIVIAELIRVFRLPILQTQFQYIPIFLSFLLGGIAYVLAKNLSLSYYGRIIFVYIQYFSSDVLYFLTFITTRVFNFSNSGIEGGVDFFENPPRAFAIVIAYCGILFLATWLKDKRLHTGIIAVILFASLAGFKIHMALPIFIGLALLGLLLLFKSQIKMFFLLVLIALLAFIIYIPVNSKAGGLFFNPFWITRDFIVQPNFKLSHLELARQVYALHGNIIQALRVDITITFIFLLALFGIKNIGFVITKNIWKKLGFPLLLFLYTVILSGIILGTFFYQVSGGANIFNFFLASTLILSILMAFNIEGLTRSKPFFIIILLIIASLTLPRWIYNTQSIKNYFIKTTPVIVKSELTAMDYIQKNTNKTDVVLVFNLGTWDSRFPYVSAFTQRDMFVSGQWILESHGVYDYKKRDIIKNKILESKNSKEVSKILQKNNIDLLYFYGKSKLSVNPMTIPLQKLFENDAITIYLFNK